MSEIKIHVLHTGTVIVDEALPFHHDYDAPLAWTGLFRSKEHIIYILVSSYLIEHPKGLILVDTGWNTVNRDHQIRNLSFQWPVNKADLPAGQAINEQLAAMGIQPQDLDYVLMSHLHCDHADGLRLVKDAKLSWSAKKNIARQRKTTFTTCQKNGRVSTWTLSTSARPVLELTGGNSIFLPMGVFK